MTNIQNIKQLVKFIIFQMKTTKCIANQYEFILFFLHFVMLTSAGVPPYVTTDYCAFKCNAAPHVHVVCQRKQDCKAAPGYTNLGGTMEYRLEVVQAVNNARNIVASGETPNFQHGGAKNMHSVSYDLELEYIVQCWLNAFKERQYPRDPCVASKRFACVDSWAFTGGSSISQIFDGILNVAKDIKQSWITNYSKKTNTGAWNIIYMLTMFADVKYIGCGKSMNNKGNVKHYACYLASDKCLEEGKPVYNIANGTSEIASECEIKNAKYKYLCGRIYPVPNDLPWTHSYKSQAMQSQPDDCIFIFIATLYYCTLLFHYYVELR